MRPETFSGHGEFLFNAGSVADRFYCRSCQPQNTPHHFPLMFNAGSIISVRKDSICNAVCDYSRKILLLSEIIFLPA
jgi:hypothetical protein